MEIRVLPPVGFLVLGRMLLNTKCVHAVCPYHYKICNIIYGGSLQETVHVHPERPVRHGGFNADASYETHGFAGDSSISDVVGILRPIGTAGYFHGTEFRFIKQFLVLTSKNWANPVQSVTRYFLDSAD